MEKMLRHRRMGFLVLAGSAILAVAIPAQPARSRNALVARADQPLGPVPAECEQGLSTTPALRVEVAELSMPAPAEPIEAPAPPSGALRTALQETQSALARNDRPAFDAARERTKSLLANYPTGGERKAAEEVVRLHDAAARLWDAQYQSPFFGQDDPLYATVSAWPGYAESVRRSVLTDDAERRFYPAAESRDFATRMAGERLQRLGLSSPTRVTPSRTMTSRTTTSRTTPSRATTPRTTAPRATKPRSTPRATSAHVTRSTSNPPKPSKPAPVTHAPGKPNPSASPTTAAVPAPAPVVVSEPKTDTPPSPAAGDVVTAEPAPITASSAPTTTAEATTDTSATFVDTALSTDVIPATPKPVAGRSVILPTILILIGLGVLIVLFRASK
jgi:hypothetical protein